MSDVDITDGALAKPPEPPVQEVVSAPGLMPVVTLHAARAPDANDVVLDNVIVGRHSEKEVRDAIAATNTPLMEQVKAAIAPI